MRTTKTKCIIDVRYLTSDLISKISVFDISTSVNECFPHQLINFCCFTYACIESINLLNR